MTPRPEPAPLLAAGGGLGLLVSLFLDWYAPGISAWTAFEVLDLVLAALALAALAPGVATIAGSIAGGVDLRSLARALPVVAALALLIVASQALNHPPAAIGAEARAGQWIALASSIALVAAAVLASRAGAPGSDRRPAPQRRAAAAGDGGARAQPRRQPDGARLPERAATAPAEARAAEPGVMGELYPEVERRGPIGGDDPEIAPAGNPPPGEPPNSRP